MERSVFGGVFIKGPGEKPLCEGDVKEAGSEPGGFWVRTWEMHGFGTTEGSGNSNQKAWLGRASRAKSSNSEGRDEATRWRSFLVTVRTLPVTPIETEMQNQLRVNVLRCITERLLCSSHIFKTY